MPILAGCDDVGVSDESPQPRIEVDLVPDQTSDDTDAGWGGEPREERDPAALLRRYLDEKPPHHGD